MTLHSLHAFSILPVLSFNESNGQSKKQQSVFFIVGVVQLSTLSSVMRRCPTAPVNLLSDAISLKPV